MCLPKRPRETREAILAHQDDYPTGVPSRLLLKDLRQDLDRVLTGFETVLASGQGPTSKLPKSALEDLRELLRFAANCVRRGPQTSAIQLSYKINEHYIPTMAAIQELYLQFDECGHEYIQERVHELREACKEACKKTTCPCPAEYVPQRANLVLPKEQESETLAAERRRMDPFGNQMTGSSFRYPITSIEHRGFLNTMSNVRASIGLGSDPANPDKGSLPYHQIQSVEILRELDSIHLASEMATKLFQVYYIARLEPVATQYFVAEWVKEVAQRMSDWMNDIRNFIKDEVNTMRKSEPAQLLPRITGVGDFPESWNVVEAAPKEKLDLSELTLEFKFLMRFGLDHRDENPLPPPKRRPPTPPRPRPAARVMPRPARPKPPRKKKSRDSSERAPRRRSSPPTQ